MKTLMDKDNIRKYEANIKWSYSQNVALDSRQSESKVCMVFWLTTAILSVTTSSTFEPDKYKRLLKQIFRYFLILRFGLTRPNDV